MLGVENGDPLQVLQHWWITVPHLLARSEPPLSISDDGTERFIYNRATNSISGNLTEDQV
jgi:hypothetical protein